MIINVAFTLLMLALSAWDLRSFAKGEHKDLKSLIMSIGILGTFVGIFVGLLGFDTRNLLDSVPTLLDGLKIAFYTSIIGMGLAIALSIYQKGRHKKEENAPINLIANQSLKLDELLYLKELSKLNGILETLRLDRDRHEDFKASMKELLGEVNASLHKALETLALGASKELIKALEIVISDFNSNLKEQFGENFKELNEATKSILVWQENYKQQVEEGTKFLENMQQTLREAQTSLAQSTESILLNKTNLEEMREYNQQNSLVQQRLIDALDQLSNLESSFESKLKSIASLKDSSLQALESSKEFIDSLSQSKQELKSYLNEYQERVLGFFESNLERINQSNEKLAAQNQGLLSAIETSHTTIVSLFEDAQANLAKSFAKTSEHSRQLATNLKQDLESKSDSLLALSQNFKQSADSMLERLDEGAAKGMELTTSMQERLSQLCENQFNALHESIEKSTEAFALSLKEQASDFKDYTSGCVEDLRGLFSSSQEETRAFLQQSHEGISASVSKLYEEFQTQLAKNYENLQAELLEIFTKGAQKQQESLDGYLDSTSKSLSQSIEAQESLAKSHTQNLSELHQAMLDKIDRNIKTTKHFINQAYDESAEAINKLHKEALGRMEATSEQTTQKTISSMEDLQTAYRENIESEMKFISQNLKDEVGLLKEQTASMLAAIKASLEEQQGLATRAIAEAMQDSKRYFTEAGTSFEGLLGGQLERLKQGFETQSKELDSYLSDQAKNLAQNLESQNHSLQESFQSQSQALSENLTRKGESLHEFLQTQTTSLDTNLQQMLGKFNKMLEHNYVNLSEMLEKDNELIIRSLDSQAVNISKALVQSQQKIDSHIQERYSKFSDSSAAIVESVGSNAKSITSHLTKSALEIQDRLEALIQTVGESHKQSSKIYEEKLEGSLRQQESLMKKLEEDGRSFYENFSSHLEGFSQNLTRASSEVQTTCQGLVEGLSNQTKEVLAQLQNLYEKNTALLGQTLGENSAALQSMQENLSTHVEAIGRAYQQQLDSMGAKNQEVLGRLEEGVTSFTKSIEGFQTGTKQSLEGLNTHFKNLCVQYVRLMQASMQGTVKSQKEASLEINTAILSIRDNINLLANSSSTLFEGQKEALDEVINHFKNRIEGLVEQSSKLQEGLGENLESLDSKLEEMTRGFANNYEWFLKRIKEIMGVSS